MTRFAIAAALLAGCATTSAETTTPPDARLEKELAGRVAGKPVSCLTLRNSQRSTTYRDAITYREGRTLYVNRIGTCPGLRSDPILVTRVYGSQVCRGDIVDFVDRTSGFPLGSCALQDFEPYTRAR